MNESVLLAAFFFPAAAAVIIFFMKYLASVLQARSRLVQDQAYQELAGRAERAHADAATAIAAVGVELAEIRSRLAGIEKILRDVE